MSIVHEALVFDRYGPRLTVTQLSDALGLAEQTIHNQIGKGIFRIRTYLDGGRRYADYRDVAQYLDDCRAGIPA